jgi:CRP-like cAMP-binding protein
VLSAEEEAMASDLLQCTVQNRLLAALSAADFELLEPKLEPIPLNLRHVLVEPDKPIKDVVFLETGLASVVATNSDRQSIEVAHVGREGLTGSSIINGVKRTPSKTFIQAPGSGLRIRSDDLIEAIEASPSLHALLLRYMQFAAIQLAHTALANGRYGIEARLARWLLMCQDRLDGDELNITHEFLSLMLGVRRAGVSVALSQLKATKAIATLKGHIVVRDRAILLKLAGGCYGSPEAEYERLIGVTAARTSAPPATHRSNASTLSPA